MSSKTKFPTFGVRADQVLPRKESSFLFCRRHKEVIGLHHYEPKKRILSAGTIHDDDNYSLLKFSVMGADLSNSQLLNISSTILFTRTFSDLSLAWCTILISDAVAPRGRPEESIQALDTSLRN